VTACILVYRNARHVTVNLAHDRRVWFVTDSQCSSVDNAYRYSLETGEWAWPCTNCEFVHGLRLVHVALIYCNDQQAFNIAAHNRVYHSFLACSVAMLH